MSNLEIIASLCSMLDEAQRIIRIQSEMLSAHGIDTYDGKLETKRENVLSSIESELGC